MIGGVKLSAAEDLGFRGNRDATAVWGVVTGRPGGVVVPPEVFATRAFTF